MLLSGLLSLTPTPNFSKGRTSLLKFFKVDFDSSPPKTSDSQPLYINLNRKKSDSSHPKRSNYNQESDSEALIVINLFI